MLQARLPRLVLPLLAALLLAAPAAADYLLLDDGRRIEGKILSETSKQVEIKTSFGTFTFPKDEIVEIKREKTRDEVYDEKLAACKTAEDFYQLGLWCEENKLRKRAEKIYKRAIKVDADHAGARAKLGFVSYKGEWMTPAERDVRQQADFEAEMLAKGLVQHEGSWVTPDEKEKLEQGLVLYDGRWIPKADAMRREGLVEHNGEWIEAKTAFGLQAAEGFAIGATARIDHVFGDQTTVVGVLPLAEMEEIAAGLDKARAWFDQTWDVKSGLKLFGGRPAEFYVFSHEASSEYVRSVDWTKERSKYIPEGWDTAVRKNYGFTWLEPIPISSARQANRGVEDLAGHCYHHMGHLMAGRLGYDGRLLPPWYEEAVAGLTELAVHDTNLVFCRSSLAGTFEGSQSDTGRDDVEDAKMRSSEWRVALKRTLERGQARQFDKLAQLEFSQLELLDIAQSMAILEWLQSLGPDALARFHKVLKDGAPPAPSRVIRTGIDRHTLYNKAFQAAAGMDFRRADSEWRRWFLNR
ncbi:MAG: hypothetical protein AAF682_31380 [Planctomycetota bacterium]